MRNPRTDSPREGGTQGVSPAVCHPMVDRPTRTSHRESASATTSSYVQLRPAAPNLARPHTAANGLIQPRPASHVIAAVAPTGLLPPAPALMRLAAPRSVICDRNAGLWVPRGRWLEGLSPQSPFLRPPSPDVLRRRVHPPSSLPPLQSAATRCLPSITSSHLATALGVESASHGVRLGPLRDINQPEPPTAGSDPSSCYGPSSAFLPPSTV
jgi:hypothetical protein